MRHASMSGAPSEGKVGIRHPANIEGGFSRRKLGRRKVLRLEPGDLGTARAYIVGYCAQRWPKGPLGWNNYDGPRVQRGRGSGATVSFDMKTYLLLTCSNIKRNTPPERTTTMNPREARDYTVPRSEGLSEPRMPRRHSPSASPHPSRPFRTPHPAGQTAAQAHGRRCSGCTDTPAWCKRWGYVREGRSENQHTKQTPVGSGLWQRGGRDIYAKRALFKNGKAWLVHHAAWE